MQKLPARETSAELRPQTVDYVASAARAALGAVPFAGSLLAELAGTVIPNQRIDRLVRFAEVLEKRLAKLEQDIVWSQFEDEDFTDLMEEGLRQAARSLSNERREYIASLIANSLSSSDIEYQESKHLLKILGEISDIEVIWLRFYLVPTLGGDEEFRQKHDAILRPAIPTLGSPQEERDRGALQESYKQHLAQLGLLAPRYRTDRQSRQPEYDRSTGAPRVEGYKLTSLGRLLLRQVGLAENDD